MPVAVYLARGAGGLGTEVYEQTLFGKQAWRFEYWRVGVADLPAEDYLPSSNPLAYGLAALMQPGERRLAELKVTCLLSIARALIDQARKALLVNCVETYLRLDAREQALYEELVAQPEQKEVEEMLTVYEERGIAIGIVRGKRETALRQLRKKFGALPRTVEARIQAMETEAELDALLDAILTARSLEDLGLKLKRKRRTANRS